MQNDDEIFIALGAFGLAYTLLLGGNGPLVATTDLSTLVTIANAAITTLDKYNMSTAVIGIAVRFQISTVILLPCHKRPKTATIHIVAYYPRSIIVCCAGFC